MSEPLKTIWQVVHRDVLVELLKAAAIHYDEHGFENVDYESGEDAHLDALAQIDSLCEQVLDGTLGVLTKERWEGTT